jgi:hypothetical protein
VSRSLTIDELAARVPLPRGCVGGRRFVARLVAEELERGTVMLTDGGFALSAIANAEWGDDLRNIGSGLQIARREAA